MNNNNNNSSSKIQNHKNSNGPLDEDQDKIRFEVLNDFSDYKLNLKVSIIKLPLPTIFHRVRAIVE